MGARWLRGVALCLPLLCGCGTTYHLLQVRPAVGTNHGRPLYLLVRAMERKAYVSESYQDVTSKVLNRDKSVLRLESMPRSTRLARSALQLSRFSGAPS